jgi:adenosylcobinamide-phosphate synthase
MIVGRDPERLDEAGVCRAAIESLAENASDGAVAPAFWYALLGLPGLLAYKMLNTADSMIGHRTERHVDFGRFAAKADDAANWIPARLTGALITLAAWFLRGGAAARRSWRVMMRDAGLHRSANAGWPEAAMAGALGIGVFWMACSLLAGLVAVLAVIFG